MRTNPVLRTWSRCSDSEESCSVGAEEPLIVFRPSPNFKNMKKFLKSKIDSKENSNQSPPNGAELSPTYNSLELVTTKEEQKALLEKAKSFQSCPPLPLAPPPVSPINFNLPQKQEIENNEYENSTPGSPVLNQQAESLPSNYETTNTEESNEQSKRTICRDFIRGNCSRGSSCRYAHECDLTQLPGVYIFCRNYQNSVCTFPHCRYVHATIFEEQRFYRTGVLPPHALSHHKKPNVLPPPPPPPPPEEPPVEVPIFANPPPPLSLKSSDKPIITCVPTANLESRPSDNNFRINNPPRDLALSSAIKCKKCDTMEFRLQFNKDKAENMKRTTDDLKSKVGILSKKTHTLYSVLLALMKLHAGKKPEHLSGLSAFMNMNTESEKTFLSTSNININLSNLLLKDVVDKNLISEARNT